MEGTLPAFARPEPRLAPRDGPLTRLNQALASPVAAFVGALGFAPGQLSIQSLTVTVVGLLRMADGQWSHMALGAGIVYLGLLLDRADAVLGQRRGRVAPWTNFLGLTIDRLVEVALLAGLGVLAMQGVRNSPIPPLVTLPPGWLLVLGTGAAGLLMAVKAIAAASDLHILRVHLLTTRRLPGPSAIPRTRPALAMVEPLAGRDETIALWCVGVALGQLSLTLAVLAVLQALLLVERIVLFKLRLNDPEVDASRVLTQG